MKTHKFADIFPLMNEKEFERLKKDIKENGLLEPITIYENKILDGRNRYKACEELGEEPELEKYDGNNPLQFVVSKNIERRDLNDSQKALSSLNWLPNFQEEAEKRQNLGAQVPEGEEGRAREKCGEVFGIGGRIVGMAQYIKENAPMEIEGIWNGTKKVSSIYRTLTLDRKKEEIEQLKELVGEYDVIVMDVPWDYGTDDAYDSENFRGTTPYPTMSLNDIKNLKLPTKDNCVLWFWTTNKFILECKEILEEYGFEIKSVLTWDKEIMGIGRWLRSQTEHCILAIKGKPYFNNTKWTTLISEKRTTHSTKPEIFYKMVEEICAGRKLDYFARKKREGWDVYGDEVK